MTYLTKATPSIAKKAAVVVSILFSGLCWYFSIGLNGDHWYLLWLAPVPIVVLSFATTSKQIFLISFFAHLTGRLSWFSYLVKVATFIPAILFTLALPLIFAIIILLTKKIIAKANPLYAVFVFPVLFTAFEWLMITFSPDGSAASIAFSQCDFLPFIQVAAVTGALGITFMVTFIPSALAMAWQFRNEKEKILPLSIISSILLAAVFIFGYSRISRIGELNEIPVGLVVLDEKTHTMGKLNDNAEITHVKNYMEEITKLAISGAKIVVLPERALNITRETDTMITNILCRTATQNNITIVTGYTNLKNKTKHNSAYVIDEQGQFILDYNKQHLVSILEDEFVPGNKIGLFQYQNNQSGVAICKDLDFPGYIQAYGKNKPIFLCIPAWDFVVDDWLHSRMAILRGVENGFSEVRTARIGRLTISDPCGRITAEANSSNGKAISLLGRVSANSVDTFYSKFGDWFGIIILITAIIFILRGVIKRN